MQKSCAYFSPAAGSQVSTATATVHWPRRSNRPHLQHEHLPPPYKKVSTWHIRRAGVSRGQICATSHLSPSAVELGDTTIAKCIGNNPDCEPDNQHESYVAVEIFSRGGLSVTGLGNAPKHF
jgi:hypothetical protein